MRHHVVGPERRSNARRMRRKMTEAELCFWNAVRAHRLMGLGFRRQVPIDGFIVDFACPAHRLIVEFDGTHHGNTDDMARDAERTKRLEALGWTVLRFWNDDVTGDVENVCRHVLAVTGLDRE